MCSTKLLVGQFDVVKRFNRADQIVHDGFSLLSAKRIVHFRQHNAFNVRSNRKRQLLPVLTQDCAHFERLRDKMWRGQRSQLLESSNFFKLW